MPGEGKRYMTVHYGMVSHPLDGCAFCWFLGNVGQSVTVNPAGTKLRIPLLWWEID